MNVRTTRRARLAAPAVAATVLSAVLTVTVVGLWLGAVMPLFLAVVIGLGLDAVWLAAQAYDRRLAAQGDHDWRVTAVGWALAVVATGAQVAHALTSDHTAAWLAVSWLPLASKILWWLHSVWERTELSPRARAEIGRLLQAERDESAVARAALRARTRADRVRMAAMAEAGADLARAQERAAGQLSGAWAALAEVPDPQEHAAVLERLAAAPAESSAWEAPRWTPVAALRASASASAGDPAGLRPAAASAQATASPQASAPRPGAPAAPAAPLSVAAAVREVAAARITDPAEVHARVAALTGRADVPRSTVQRELRNVRASAAPAASARIGFAPVQTPRS
ncbi:protein spdB [Kitasatospora sp. NPDC092039]|uniref:protein spdB n=1 Tax=Kitasatospora sp. NPDC092039 TaxID=3364086 RepID=UPI00380A748C